MLASDSAELASAEEPMEMTDWDRQGDCAARCQLQQGVRETKLPRSGMRESRAVISTKVELHIKLDGL
jgi:hypothetical protein